MLIRKIDEPYPDEDGDLPLFEKMRRGDGKGHAGDNTKQNRAFDKIMKDRNLTPEQARRVHDAISGRGYSIEEIEQIADDMRMMMGTVLDRFLPMNVSGVRPGHGSFFSVDLTSNSEEKCSLWIYLCGWAILTGQNAYICSDNPKEEIDDYLLLQWKPQKLISAKINDKIEVEFHFDNSRLRLFPYPETYGIDADIFRLFDDENVHYLRFEDKKIRETPRVGLRGSPVSIRN